MRLSPPVPTSWPEQFHAVIFTNLTERGGRLQLIDLYYDWPDCRNLNLILDQLSGDPLSNALYIVSIGTNDFLENYFPLITGRFKEFTVDEFQDFLIAQAEDFLAKIYRLGARRVTFAGLSPIGCLPLERTLNTLRGRCIEEYNQVAREYNVKVKAMIRRLCASLPGLKIAYVPVYEDMLNLINNPSTLGLENVEEGCCATGKFEMGYLCNDKSPLTCEDADKYFFWDSFHPTEKVNQFFAKSTLEICKRELL